MTVESSHNTIRNLKRCKVCGELKDASGFRYPKGKCFDCRMAIQHEYMEMNREAIKEQKNAWHRAHPEVSRRARRAHWARHREELREIAREKAKTRPPTQRDPFKEAARRKLRNAVVAGRVEKPANCEDCGIADSRLHGHHEDYSRPLDVAWLCSICHGIRHRKVEAA